MKQVVIIGMGFGGLKAAQGLAGKNVEVLVLDRQNYHLFQPLLYQVASANIEQESIAYPVRAITRRWRNVRYRMAEVRGIDLENRTLTTDDGPVTYDTLIVAAGAVTNFLGIESVEKSAYDLKYLSDAVALRNHILRCFEEAVRETDPAKRQALMTAVIVGGGPTGVEFAGALAELVRHVLTKDYPELSNTQARIVLLDALPHLLGAYDEPLRDYARRRLERIGVEVRTNAKVREATPDRVVLDDGVVIDACTLIWSAGVKAAPLADVLDDAARNLKRAHVGRIAVEPDLSLPGHPEVVVIGDMAYVEQDGKPLPMMAPVAMQQGEYAAKAILAREKGQRVEPFRYVDRGTMAVIGRGAAVARVFGMNFKGFAAWLVWLALHLFMLIGFRNRMVVLLGWAVDYFSFDRKVRLILRDDSNLYGRGSASDS